ncbi:hypothetical protein J3F83DRAFT_629136 [Trichoderma novae-zelandiae]
MRLSSRENPRMYYIHTLNSLNGRCRYVSYAHHSATQIHPPMDRCIFHAYEYEYNHLTGTQLRTETTRYGVERQSTAAGLRRLFIHLRLLICSASDIHGCRCFSPSGPRQAWRKSPESMQSKNVINQVHRGEQAGFDQDHDHDREMGRVQQIRRHRHGRETVQQNNEKIVVVSNSENTSLGRRNPSFQTLFYDSLVAADLDQKYLIIFPPEPERRQCTLPPIASPHQRLNKSAFSRLLLLLLLSESS